jgi:hypothetical protein
MKKRLAAQLIRKTWLILAFSILALFSLLYSSNIQCEWSGIQKIVAVGDLHGDYDSFVDILKGTGLVDRNLHWTGGKTHLVQIGDVMDRGDHAKDILELLMRLEKEAEQAGGKVHFLLGNHEEMNITGISWEYENYVTLNQFIDFLPESYKERQERKIRKDYAKKPPKGSRLDYPLEQRLSNYWKTVWSKAIANRQDSARIEYIRNFREKYGKWLVQHNAVIKIDDIVFVHGGISDRFSTWKLEEINNRMRLELNSFINDNPIEDLQVVYDRNGPLWYRGLAENGIKEEDLKPEVDRTFQKLGIKYMILAHTTHIIKSKDEMNRFDGRIWIIDTGINSKIYRGGRETALIIEETGNDLKFSVWPFDFNEESTEAIEQARYLQEGMAPRARQLLEFIDYALKDTLRMEIFYRGEQ